MFVFLNKQQGGPLKPGWTRRPLRTLVPKLYLMDSEVQIMHQAGHSPSVQVCGAALRDGAGLKEGAELSLHRQTRRPGGLSKGHSQ